jgi:hypothetical protein
MGKRATSGEEVAESTKVQSWFVSLEVHADVAASVVIAIACWQPGSLTGVLLIGHIDWLDMWWVRYQAFLSRQAAKASWTSPKPRVSFQKVAR